MTTKLCECGCGRPTTINKKSYNKRGIVKGEPRRFIRGHYPAHIHRTDETFAKIGAAQLGRKPSADSLAKMSASHIGKPTGRHTSPSAETRAKISASLKGRPLDPEVTRKMAERQAGRPMPEASVRALRDPAVQERRLAALRAAFAARPKKPKPERPKYGSPEWRAAISASLQRPESKRRLSDAAKEVAKRPEVRAAKAAAADRNRKVNSDKKRQWWAVATPEQRSQMALSRSMGQKQRWAAKSNEQKLLDTAAARFKTATLNKAIWAGLTPDQRRDKMRPVFMAGLRANPSSIELTVRALLDSLGVSYEPQVAIGRFTVDILIPDKRLVIECDGSYWHGLPGRPEADAKRDEWFRSNGFSILRLKEADIRAGRVVAQLAEIA